MFRYFLIFILIVITVFVSFFYFEFPLKLIKPVFYQKTVVDYAKRYNVDPILITAIIKVESNFFHRARSKSGAIGLMQILPSTGEELSKELGYTNFNISDLENPKINIHLGVYYFSKLLKQFNGSVILALAAYNAGISKVNIWYKQNPLMEIETEYIPYLETRRYVQQVIKIYEWLKRFQELKNLIRTKKA